MRSFGDWHINQKKNHEYSTVFCPLPAPIKFFRFIPQCVNPAFANQRGGKSVTTVNETGFTLIEILLVIILLGVLLTVSIPNFQSSFKTLLLKDTANDMAALMRYAQSRSIVQKTPIEFVYDSGSATFGLYQASKTQGTPEGGQESARISDRRGKEYKVPPEIACEATAPTITFSPDGRISHGRFTLCLKDKCLTVSTQDQSGRVLLLEGTLK